METAPALPPAETDQTPEIPQPVGARRRLLIGSVAAAVIVAAVSMTLLFRSNPGAPGQPLAAGEVSTSKSKTRIRLPDGSVVILNKQSKLVYNKDFGINKRDITLTGEAFFDIAKNDNVPLTVTAGTVKIVVMGTAFNVRAYADDSTIETSLIRGSIEVSSSDVPDRVIRMRPNEKLTFGKEPPPAAVAAPAKRPLLRRPAQNYLVMNKIKLNPIDGTINEIVWVQDKLVFSKEPFYSVAEKMERWFQVKIRFRDKISEQLTMTGSLEKENLVEALEALRLLTPFNYQIDNGIVTISKKTNPIH
jgi:ferric-dicitrate binding protein FerR (iron transport regulator)